MTKSVTVKRVAASLLYKAWIDGNDLAFASDVSHADLEPGRHALTWVVQGPPGGAYGISITAPRESHFEYSASFDRSGKDAGLHWFEVHA